MDFHDYCAGVVSAKQALAALPASEPDMLFSIYSYAIDRMYVIKCLRFPLNDSDQSKNNQWSPPILLLESDGAHMPVPSLSTPGLCSTVVGDHVVIISCASAWSVPKGSTLSSDNGQGMFVGIYDKTKLDLDGNEWKAEYSTYLPYPSGFQYQDMNRALLEWFPNINPDGTLEHFLLALRIKDEYGRTNPMDEIAAFVSPMTLSDKGAVTLTGFKPIGNANAGATAVTFENNQPPQAQCVLATLRRDPTGRLRGWFSTGNNKNFVAYNLAVDLIGGTLLFTPDHQYHRPHRSTRVH